MNGQFIWKETIFINKYFINKYFILKFTAQTSFLLTQPMKIWDHPHENIFEKDPYLNTVLFPIFVRNSRYMIGYYCIHFVFSRYRLGVFNFSKYTKIVLIDSCTEKKKHETTPIWTHDCRFSLSEKNKEIYVWIL